MKEIETKKSLGQHWLHDVDVLSDMVELAEVQATDDVVEVGPGLGTLTEFLLNTGAQVTAVEFDDELYERLQTQKAKLFGKSADNLQVVHEDILQFRFDQQPKDFKVVANIPYYLTSNLIRVLSELDERPSVVALLIQKEVAERLCATPGNMSLLSVWAQVYFVCELGSVVPARLFTPPPKVDSQIVVMRRRDEPVFSSADKKTLHKLIKAGFSNKRKTLHNSLSAGLHMNKDQVSLLLTDSGLSTLVRPQELSLDDWQKLATTYIQSRHQQVIDK